jgi:hypothetical protein
MRPARPGVRGAPVAFAADARVPALCSRAAGHVQHPQDHGAGRHAATAAAQEQHGGPRARPGPAQHSTAALPARDPAALGPSSFAACTRTRAPALPWLASQAQPPRGFLVATSAAVPTAVPLAPLARTALSRLPTPRQVSPHTKSRDMANAKYMSILNIIQGEVDPSQVQPEEGILGYWLAVGLERWTQARCVREDEVLVGGRGH